MSFADEINGAAGFGKEKSTGHALTDEINAGVAASSHPKDSLGLSNFMDVVPGVKGFRSSTLDPVAAAVKGLEGHLLGGILGSAKAMVTGGDMANAPSVDPVQPLAGNLPTKELPVYGPGLPLQELIPGMGVMTPYAKQKAIETSRAAAHQSGGGLDLGMVANVASGLPGAVADTGTDLGLEFLSQMIHSAPENVALPLAAAGAGMVAPTVAKGASEAGQFLLDQTPNLRGAVANAAATHAPLLTDLAKQVATDAPGWLFHRGGFDAAAKADFGNYDTGVIRAAHAAEDASLPLAEANGRPTTPAERQFMEMLAMQPEQRKMLMAHPPDVPFTVNAAYQQAAQEVPGIPGAREAAMTMYPESDIPAATFAKKAEAFSQEAGLAKQHVEAAYGKDPTTWSRLNADNWFPQDFAANRVGTYPVDRTAMMRERTGFMSTRGDLSWEARQANGVTDPVERAYTRIYQEHRSATTRDLFNNLAMNPIVTYRPGLGGPNEMQEIASLATGQRVWKEGVQYVKMAADQKLGPLAGQLVKAPEAAEINAMIRNPGALRRTLNRWWSSWKFEKTVLNPKTQIRNLTANVMMAHAEGLSPYRLDVYKKALSELKAGGAGWDEARAAGAAWTTRARPSVLDDILTHQDLNNSENAYESFFSALPRWMMKNKGSAAMSRGYQDSEALFKHALYLYKREQGVPIHQAISEADAAILNYGKMPQWVKQLRTLPGGIPFVSFTYGATGVAAKALLNKPQIFLHYKLFADSWNELAFARTKATDQERNDLAALYQGTVPMVEMNRDASGSLKVYDAARSTPISDLLPGRTDIGGLAGVAGNIFLKDPLITEAATMMTGRDPRTKTDVFPMEVPGAQAGANAYGIPPETQSLLFDTPRAESNRAIGRHLVQTVTPGPVSDAMNILDVANGRTNLTGDKVPMSDALFAALFGPTQSLNQEKLRAGMRLQEQSKVATSAAKRKYRREHPE